MTSPSPTESDVERARCEAKLSKDFLRSTDQEREDRCRRASANRIEGMSLCDEHTALRLLSYYKNPVPAEELLARAFESSFVKPDISHAHLLRKVRDGKFPSDGDIPYRVAISAIKSIGFTAPSQSPASADTPVSVPEGITEEFLAKVYVQSWDQHIGRDGAVAILNALSARPQPVKPMTQDEAQ